jgi:hypothetical protein
LKKIDPVTVIHTWLAFGLMAAGSFVVLGGLLGLQFGQIVLLATIPGVLIFTIFLGRHLLKVN